MHCGEGPPNIRRRLKAMNRIAISVDTTMTIDTLMVSVARLLMFGVVNAVVLRGPRKFLLSFKERILNRLWSHTAPSLSFLRLTFLVRTDARLDPIQEEHHCSALFYFID